MMTQVTLIWQHKDIYMYKNIYTYKYYHTVPEKDKPELFPKKSNRRIHEQFKSPHRPK